MGVGALAAKSRKKNAKEDANKAATIVKRAQKERGILPPPSPICENLRIKIPLSDCLCVNRDSEIWRFEA